jgi:hypothetical protein
VRRLAVAAVVALALCAGATSGAASPSSSDRQARTTCVAGRDFGWAKENVIFTGSPARIVRLYCRATRKVFRDGFQNGASRLICGGTNRDFPGVSAGVFSTRAGSAIVRRYCRDIFSPDSWIRFR